jgi:TnpA family transposase
MALAKLLGFDLCPRLKALKDRHLFPPRGTAIRASVHEICSATVDLERIRSHWDETVHLVASVHSGHTSAVHVTARYGYRRLAAIRSTKPSSTSADYCAPCSCVTTF